MKKLLSFIVSMTLSIGLVGCASSSGTSTADGSAETDTTTTTETTTKDTTMTYEIDPNKPLVALTFDDGPNRTTTNEVLDVLEEYNVRASFFLIGNNINFVTEDVMLRAHEMGCELGNHSLTHSDMTRMTPEEIQEELTFVSDKIEEVTGSRPAFFRPPYIAVNNTMYETIDMTFICGVGCNDWDPNVTVQERIDNTLNQVEDGTIILLHDSQGNSQTVEALRTIIPTLLEEGYQFVTVTELFEAKGVAIDPADTNMYTVVK